ncbi:hypothetical protein [Nocardioides sp. LHG3406-4]|uniref:hypothetical protein n=1 Tax=Nocardioides sp. LHG3406-4 TaxID=2804575 RepID=UPI003CF6FD65
MTSNDEPGRERDLDRAWRDIVDHYGERPTVAPETPPPPDPGLEPELVATTPPVSEQYDEEERFVPPPPPPLPWVEPKRRVAWLGLFGAPLVLLLFTVFGWGMPRLLAYALVMAFVGGFLYLVANMPRGPRDPGDDGARI